MPPDQKMNFLHIYLGIFQTGAFALDPGVRETTCEPFKGRISVSYSTLGPLDISPFGFVSEAFLEGHLSCSLSRTEESDVGNKSFVPLGEVLGW